MLVLLKKKKHTREQFMYIETGTQYNTLNFISGFNQIIIIHFWWAICLR